MNRFIDPKIIESLCFWNYTKKIFLRVPKKLRIAIFGVYEGEKCSVSSKKLRIAIFLGL